MATENPFGLYDCSLLRRATGYTCTNLRELLEAVRTVPEGVIEHHMMRCPLEDHFELYEFPNDLARWCWNGLGAHALGEALGLVDPYRYESLAELRGALVAVIEGQLWEMQQVASCPPGLELHLISSQLAAYDTGERFYSPTALAEGVRRMSPRSLFYHVHEGHRRTDTDDFSAWLEGYGANPNLVAGIRDIDFYFLNLGQLREEIVRVFREHLPEPEMTFSAGTK